MSGFFLLSDCPETKKDAASHVPICYSCLLVLIRGLITTVNSWKTKKDAASHVPACY